VKYGGIDEEYKIKVHNIKIMLWGLKTVIYKNAILPIGWKRCKEVKTFRT